MRLLIQIPIAVVVTKIDICPPTVLKQTRQALAKYLRQNQKMPYPIKELSQVRAAHVSRCLRSKRFTSLAKCLYVLTISHTHLRSVYPLVSPFACRAGASAATVVFAMNSSFSNAHGHVR